MGTQISNIVSVSITKESARVMQTGFGTPILVGDTAGKQLSRAVSYSDPADMLTTNGGPYATSDDLYIAAINLMAQDVSVESFLIGRKKETENQQTSIVFDADATAGTFTLTIGGNTTGNIDYDDSASDVQTAINALSNVSGVTVALNTGATQAGDAEGFTIAFADSIKLTVTATISGLTGPTTATITEVDEATHATTAVPNQVSISFDADATAGTFTLTCGGETTAGIAYDAAVGVVKSAIELLTNITTVTVALNSGATQAGDQEGFTVTFDGDVGTDFATTCDESGLTGPTTSYDYINTETIAIETWATAYAAIKAADNTWYDFIPIERVVTASVSEFTALAAIVEADTKQMCLITADSNALTSATSDIGYALEALDYDRTACVYSGDTTYWLNAAWDGRCLPEKPGSVNWAYQSLSGVTADSLTTAQLGYLDQKAYNYFEEVGGVNIISSHGIAASGEYRDVTRGIDLLTARIGEAVFAALVNANKIPFTVQGIAKVKNIIESTLITYGVNYGIITEDSIVVSAPELSAIPSSEKAARWLNNVTFSATMQGAINTITITGKLVV